jgi:CBS domain containing-hemolysin-like protein
VSSFWVWLSIVLLLGLDLAAVASRGAYLQSSHARLLALKERLDREVSESIVLLQALARLRASLGLLLVWTRLALSALLILAGLPALAGWAGLTHLLIIVGAGFTLFVLEWLVERGVGREPEAWALRLLPFVRIVMGALTLPLALPLALTREAEYVDENSGAVTTDELKTLVDAGQQDGVLEQGERRMIHSIFDLGDTLAREIMVPRIDMLAFDVSMPVGQAVEELLRSGHSRVPVYEETVDHTLGLLYAKDLLRVWSEGSRVESLRALLRPAYFIPEAKRVDALLAEMQSRRIHMAIVVDEYGGVAGLVTLEDIIEEILGEIQDEYDQSEEAPFQRLTDGGVSFLGRIDLDDFNEIMGSTLSKEEADTLGGYIYNHLGRIPGVDEQVQVGSLVLVVEQVIARRIRKVRAYWASPADEAGQEKVDQHADG